MEQTFVKYSNLTLTFKDGAVVKVDKETIHKFFEVIDTILEADPDMKNIDMKCAYSDFRIFLEHVYEHKSNVEIFLLKHLDIAEEYGFLKQDLPDIFSHNIPQKILDSKTVCELIHVANKLEIFYGLDNLIINILYLVMFTDTSVLDIVNEVYLPNVIKAIQLYFAHLLSQVTVEFPKVKNKETGEVIEANVRESMAFTIWAHGLNVYYPEDTDCEVNMNNDLIRHIQSGKVFFGMFGVLDKADFEDFSELRSILKLEE